MHDGFVFFNEKPHLQAVDGGKLLFGALYPIP